jgi:hypothetical protein
MEHFRAGGGLAAVSVVQNEAGLLVGADGAGIPGEHLQIDFVAGRAPERFFRGEPGQDGARAFAAQVRAQTEAESGNLQQGKNWT